MQPRIRHSLVLLALVALGCGGGGSGGSQSSGTVSVRDSGLGKILVDGSGRTLYLFERDKGRSACEGACAQAWPPLIAHGRVSAGGGASTSLVGTVRRPDGTSEVTYAGHPLYRYSGDQSAGDVNGQGSDAFGAEWYVLAANGRKVEKDKPSGGGGGGGSYGY
jgi:predicted lipoprotein with Yx(FWY)xxD motif